MPSKLSQLQKDSKQKNGEKRAADASPPGRAMTAGNVNDSRERGQRESGCDSKRGRAQPRFASALPLRLHTPKDISGLLTAPGLHWRRVSNGPLGNLKRSKIQIPLVGVADTFQSVEKVCAPIAFRKLSGFFLK